MTSDHSWKHRKKSTASQHQESEKRWQFSLEEAGVGFWEWHVAENRIHRSPQLLKMFQLEPDDLGELPHTWRQRIHPEDQPRFLENLRLNREEKRIYFEDEYRVQRKNGSYAWILDKGKVVETDATGNPRLVFGYVTDITRQKRAEEALRAERNLFTNGPTIIFRWKNDPAWPMVEVSPNVIQTFGYTREELLKSIKSYTALIHPEDLPKLERQALNRFNRESDQSTVFYYRILSKSQRPVWVMETAARHYHSEEDAFEILGYVNDITPLIEAEQSLAVKTVELDTFFQVSRELACVMDENRYFIKVNKAWKKILGYEAKELVGRHCTAFMPSDDEGWRTRLKALQHEGEKVFAGHVNRYCDTSGNIHYIEWQMTTHDGKIYASGRDITDQLFSMDQLKKTETRLRKIMNNMEAVVLVVDRDSDEILFLNQKARQLFGPLEGEKSTSAIWQRMQQNPSLPIGPGKEKTRETTAFRDDQGRWYEVRQSEIEWIDGRQVNLVVKMDMTEMKEIQEAYQQSEREKEVLLQAIPDSLFVNDLEGNCLQQYLKREPDLAHYETPAHLSQFFSDAFTQTILEKYRQAVREKTMMPLEYSIDFPDKTRHYETRIVALDDQRVLSVERDVTSAREMQEATQMALRSAEAANQAKSRFLANMSHEIRTPLNGIVGNLDLLAETVLNETQQRHIHSVNAFIEILLHTVNDILDISKIEAGHMQLEERPFQLVAETQQVMEGFASFAKNRNNQLIFQAEPYLPEWVIGDVVRYKQVLNNLISNALKFTHKGEVILSLVSTYQTVDEVGLCIDVEDTGIGIEADQLEMLFEAFIQADLSTTRQYGGTGLGLAITRQLVQMMNGHLSVESQPGKGSRFSVSLSLLRAAPLQKGTEEGAGEGEGKNRYRFAGTVPPSPPDAAEQQQEKISDFNGKAAFIAGMSHELRTPLNAILGMTEALLDEVCGPLTEKQVRSLKTIETSGRHLLEMINEILDTAKISLGKLTIQQEPVALKTLCESIIRNIEAKAASKKVIVAFEYDETVNIIHADGRRLKQALQNLLANALKFSETGDHMGLTVEKDNVNNQLKIIVWDQGIGIAAEDLTLIFNPFTQVENSLNRRFEGAGLGLSLAKGIIEQHGGSLEVESIAGKGSRFIMHLPLEKSVARTSLKDTWKETGPGFQENEPTASAQEPFRRPEDFPPPVILLAEDQEANIETFCQYLEQQHWQLMVARNGKEAVEKAIKHLPDLILMDMHMPEMDGFEAIRHIRNHPRLGQIPIIALTALAMSSDRERCLAAGADTYLSKPVRLKELKQIIQWTLEKKDQDFAGKGADRDESIPPADH
ncbi:ATP-binding protein [Anoxynatronum buryatiense]|uniref:Circadian input-output histidine kinase CikA n=1 Tax=Anoxynatronum buryatiense TaxID=489973 RepID=A0AA46AJ45_9CLOT|nr:ATP-binding protein [Anoxynatronum buryatiense]SMP57870.1 PAS domain S-box-containing protein [Anoxynatronum buryatiense]